MGKSTSKLIITRRLADAILVSGTSATQARMFSKVSTVWTQTSNSGSLIGPAAEAPGTQKAVARHSIEVNTWMSTINILESIIGLIGVFNRTSRKMSLPFGRR